MPTPILGCCWSWRICSSARLTSSRRAPARTRTSSAPLSKAGHCCMQPDSRRYLYDIQTACRKLEGFTRDRSLEDYLANEMLRSAVERPFEIIGQAARPLWRIGSDLVSSVDPEG